MSLVSYLSLAILVIGFVALFVILWAFRRSPANLDESIWLSSDEIGKIERDLRNLQDVFIVADQIETPTQMLRDAVVDNIMENVRYHFIVPAKNYEWCVEHVFPTLQATENFARRASGSTNLSESPLVSISALSFSRHDYPYIFYVYGADKAEKDVIAFRGDEVGRGIAEVYRRVEPEFAYSLWQHVVANAANTNYTKQIDLEAFLYADTGNVVELRKAKPIHSKTEVS